MLAFIQSPTIMKRLQSAYSEDLSWEYANALNDLVTQNPEYTAYTITVTPWSPNYVMSINDFLGTIRSIHDQIQRIVFKQKNRKRRPDYLRPFMVFLMDLEGSKGAGIWLRHQLRENSNGVFKNLHMHGILLVHNKTNLRFKTHLLQSSNFFDVEINEIKNPDAERWEVYCAKAVNTSNLMHEQFFTAYGFLSDQNLELTPDQITSTMSDWKRDNGIGAHKKAA